MRFVLLFLAVLGLHRGAQASHGRGFSCCRGWAPGCMGFLSTSFSCNLILLIEQRLRYVLIFRLCMTV